MISENLKTALKDKLHEFGLPRMIIAGFLVVLFITAPFVGVSMSASLTDIFNRFGQNELLTLAMIPMILSGAGLNFGLSLGVIAGLLGSTIAMQLGLTGWMGIFGAMAVSIPFGILFGWLYSLLLNRVRGEEMTIALYVGFAAVMFMSIMWLVLPYTSENMVWGYSGEGLRTTITLDGYWVKQLNDFLAINIGDFFVFPTGMILFCAVMSFFMWLFIRSKTGTAITAVGSNPDYARAGGININRMRTISIIVSTVTGAIGILVYQQSYGFIQLYQAPLFMAFPAVAAILIGGASINKASILNVIVGTVLFQGILTLTPSVINSVLQTDVSEVIRIVLSNGMILYALTRKTGATR
ncbi:ABC transporter permease [Treponema parvum]|uniref:ABC transporter permease n=1 Tax=Treponema parvum TaxID=138851 RepID=A0A975EYH5_9SPIR|nr:ABC transporter permease [Treponema parvum]QTQ11224.1 ABC transporter permease [Treponema parvum]